MCCFAAARVLGRIIISEAALPSFSKSIAPVDAGTNQSHTFTRQLFVAGGIAGGEKFTCCGIFFKRVFDSHGIYGSEDAALKSARHELKVCRSSLRLLLCSGCVVLQGARAFALVRPVSQLRTPLMTVVDFRGFRLLATSLVPIGSDTLHYGSNDGCFCLAYRSFVRCDCVDC